ncbi:MAG TPA: gamma-glutamyltransferase [Nocardioidaceae bacterium]|nr:gamma-glutamyltransferase [Nocardioidaceae bacterium]
MSLRRTRSIRAAVFAAAGATALAGALVGTAQADPRYSTKTPTSKGFGGAVSSVDPEASKIGIEVLKRGGNAVDAAVATAAALGVTEPYSAGIGGGGYFVFYDADTEKVMTIDGRETAPEAIDRDAFIDPATGEPYNFFPERVTSGVSIGVPGTLATWEKALDEWGSYSLRKALRPATKLARRGFVVDETFEQQTVENQERFEAYTTTPELFLPGGEAPEPGSIFRNRDLARTYQQIAKRGTDYFYEGPLAEEIVAVVQDPPKSPTTDLPVPPGEMTLEDLDDYRAKLQKPTKSDYRGYEIFGMAPSSSGGTTVGESLNIVEQSISRDANEVTALHHYLEASALAFADRAAYLGDPAFVDVPVQDLLSDKFARERACEIDPDEAAVKPVPAQDVDDYDGKCDPGDPGADADVDTEGLSTTNLTVTDKWGNVVEYTLTIEQTGGSGLLVPDRGFLLNNELTDFSAEFDPDDPNRIEGGKRPRSSMSPTIVLDDDGEPFLALGTPGGSTIITTVSQILFNRIDLGMTIEEALAAPRASQRNTETVTAEPAFISEHGAALRALGHEFTESAEIGAATAIEFGKNGLLTAVAEPVRRGGGSALVVSDKRVDKPGRDHDDDRKNGDHDDD